MNWTPKRGGLLVLRSVLWGLAFLLSSTAAFAQAVPDTVGRDAERNQEREQERQRARDEQFRENQSRPPSGIETPAAPAEVDKGGNCVAIHTVTLQGMTRYKQSDFAAALAKLNGDCISVGIINEALRVITNRYVGDGYVTSRAVVGPQDLTDGGLEITVFEGQVGAVKGDQGGYGKNETAMAFPGLKGKQLNLRAIEQGVDQLSRLPSYEPDIDIAPSDLPGASIVIVKRKHADNPARTNVVFSNDGSQSTGRFNATTTLDVDSPLGLADFWSLYYSHDLYRDRFRGTEGLGGFVSLPYGYWTLSLSGGYSNYQSLLVGNGQSFSNNGRSFNGSATLDRLIYRDARTKIGVSTALSVVDAENRIQGIRLSTSSYRIVTAAIDWRLQRKMLNGLVSVNLGFTHGLNILEANAVDTGPGGATILFREVDASLTYQSEFKLGGVPFNYTFLIRGQTTLDPVFPARRFSLGGSSTVRGFRDDGISGRHGIFMRQQIGFLLFKFFSQSDFAGTSVSGFVGYDAGGILPKAGDAFERGALQSVTAGLRAQTKHLQFELGLSRPLSAPSFIKHKDVDLAASLRVAF